MQNYPQVKRIPAHIGKALTYAIQHFESVVKREAEIDDNLRSAVMLPTIRETKGSAEHAIEFARTLMESEIALVIFSPAESAVYEMAILEWNEELQRARSQGTSLWAECVELLIQYGNAKWTPIR